MKRLFKKETGIKLALMFIIASMVLVMMPAGMLYADAIGPNSGTSFANIGFGVTWSNTQNAAASDNLYATTPLSKPTGVTVPLSATGFNFNIPSGSTINGIEVMVERSQTTAGRYYDDHLRLIRNGVPSTSAIKYGGNPNVVGFIPLTDATITFGGPTDLWSESWTVDDINNAGFGFYFTARTSYTGSICKVDFMSMTVYYTLPSDTTPPVIDPVADITL